MSEILLVTANARYIHSSLGLRCLLANMGDLQPRTSIMELTLLKTAADAAEKILAQGPTILGVGVYTWNVDLMGRVLDIVRKVQPDLKIVLGGPEVSFASDLPDMAGYADVIIGGEAETTFPDVCRRLLAGETPVAGFVQGSVPRLDLVQLPYSLYNPEDIANRVIYVEASRGCPYGCQFCLSSLDKTVRRFPLEKVLASLGALWEQGVRRFKFVDRALHLADTPALLEFFAARQTDGLFLHFEWVPERMPEDVLELLSGFPPGAVQLEAGIQTFTPQVALRIDRKQDPTLAVQNMGLVLRQTGAHLHTDLVAGLPGETVHSFGASFDRLAAVRPHEIQLGILKRLRGAPICQHETEFAMQFGAAAPYEVLQTESWSFPEMQETKRFSRYLDMLHNSGNFKETLALLFQQIDFGSFMQLARWLWGATGQTSHIHLDRLACLLFQYGSEEKGLAHADLANALAADWTRCGRGLLPKQLRPHITTVAQRGRPEPQALPPRQKRHL
jgi:hypothetical protein